MTRRQVKRSILKIVAFIGIFIILYAAMTAVFSNHPDFRIAQSIRAFYDEPADSLQGVYIGTSTCYAFWNALMAWKNHGLTVFPYTCAGMPLYATEYVIREVRKTQPDALFIVNINSVVYDAMGSGAQVLPEEYRRMMRAWLGWPFRRLIDVKMLKK